MENVEHTLFVCARWGAEWEAAGRSVKAQLTPNTMVSLMLQSEQKWMLMESFVTLVMKTREIYGRAELVDNVYKRFRHFSSSPKKKKKKKSCIISNLVLFDCKRYFFVEQL